MTLNIHLMVQPLQQSNFERLNIIGKNKKQKKLEKAIKVEEVATKPPLGVTTVKTTKKTIFVYDMLNTHHVQRTIWGEAKSGAPYILNDYELKAYANGTLYVEKKLGERVSGKLYELTDDQLKDTDWYETESYERARGYQDKISFEFYRKVKEVK
jgi:hypothetical protein